MSNITSNISLMTNKEILKLIGTRIKKERVAQNLQQEELANKCELSIRAIQRLEQTGEIGVGKLIIILRNLNRLSEIDNFIVFPNELEDLNYEEYKNKIEEQKKKRVFKAKNNDLNAEW